MTVKKAYGNAVAPDWNLKNCTYVEGTEAEQNAVAPDWNLKTVVTFVADGMTCNAVAPDWNLKARACANAVFWMLMQSHQIGI